MTRWAAIVGARGAGKSSHAAAAAKMLLERGVRVGGFLQQAHEDDLGRRSYDLVRLGTSAEPIALARPGNGEEIPGRTSFCSYSFADDGFAAARQWLEQDFERGVDVVLIDEVSKMEAAGQGHYASIRTALEDSRAVTVLCIRADQMFYVVEKLELEDDPIAVLEIPPEEEVLAQFVQDLAEDVGVEAQMLAQVSATV